MAAPRRQCSMCERFLDPREYGVRCADERTDARRVRLRWWLCCRCAGKMQRVMDTVKGQKLQAVSA